MLEKLLLAVDDSAQSRKAVPATAELARAGVGTVNVLHVRELHYPVPPTVAGDRPEDAQRLVDDVVGELEGPGSRPRARSGPAPAARRPRPSWSAPASSTPA